MIEYNYTDCRMVTKYLTQVLVKFSHIRYMHALASASTCLRDKSTCEMLFGWDPTACCSCCSAPAELSHSVRDGAVLSSHRTMLLHVSVTCTAVCVQ